MLCVVYINEGQGVSRLSNIMDAILVKKNIDVPGRQINDPSLGSTLSVPPTNSVISVTDPWADKLFKGSQPCLLHCFRKSGILGHCQLCHTRHGGASTKSGTADEKLDCKFDKKTLVFMSADIGGYPCPTPLSTPLRVDNYYWQGSSRGLLSQTSSRMLEMSSGVSCHNIHLLSHGKSDLKKIEQWAFSLYELYDI